MAAAKMKSTPGLNRRLNSGSVVSSLNSIPKFPLQKLDGRVSGGADLRWRTTAVTGNGQSIVNLQNLASRSPVHGLVVPEFGNGSDLAKPELKAAVNPFPHLVGPEASHRVRDAFSCFRLNYVPLSCVIEAGTVEANPVSSVGGREVYPHLIIN